MLGSVLLVAVLSFTGSHSHSHNDYAQARPLIGAVEHHMASVEADVFLVGGKLLVAHTIDETSPERSLQALYCDPLRALIAQRGGKIYPDGPLILFIDIKSEAAITYTALQVELARMAPVLTQFEGNTRIDRAITVILSGNVPRTVMAAQTSRLAACDGRPADLAANPSPNLVPLISDLWTNHFHWEGHGEMPDAERDALRALVARCHEQGRLVRFWAAPDTVDAWREQLAAGVDLINTDQPAALETFLAQSRH